MGKYYENLLKTIKVSSFYDIPIQPQILQMNIPLKKFSDSDSFNFNRNLLQIEKNPFEIVLCYICAII